VNTKQPFFAIFCLALVTLLAGNLRADTVTLTPSADTSIYSGAPDNNLGANDAGDNGLASGGVARGGNRFRMLMRFDFTGQIPANATINSVKLTLRVRKAPAGGVASSFELHRMLKNWTEGRGSGSVGSAAVAGEATWRNQAHPSTAWSAAGAAAPGDFVAEVSAAQTMNAVGNYTYDSTPTLVADVQKWVSDPASNFGWILISAREGTARTARRIDSRESGANAPSLVVDFTPGVVVTPPQITQGLQNQTVAVGANVTLNVTATGTEPLTYQWKRGDTVLAETSATLTLNGVQLSDTGTYTVTVSNAGGSQTSSATLTVMEPPRITSAPLGFRLFLGANVTMAVTVSGSDPLSFVWRKDGNVMSGQTGPSISLNSLTADDGGAYTVEVSNPVGKDTASITVTMLTPAKITTPPQNQTVEAGANVTFTVAVTGSEPLTVQWKKGDQILPGESGLSLTRSAVTAADAGTYTVEVSNTSDQGTAKDSASATLTVNTPTGPLRIEPAAVVNGKLTFNFTAEPNRTYAVQVRNSLTAGDWVVVETFPATAQARSVSFSDPQPPTAPQRFYRVAVTQ
jgi:hypothetical protein